MFQDALEMFLRRSKTLQAALKKHDAVASVPFSKVCIKVCFGDPGFIFQVSQNCPASRAIAMANMGSRFILR
jgi:hypothetical protein